MDSMGCRACLGKQVFGSKRTVNRAGAMSVAGQVPIILIKSSTPDLARRALQIPGPLRSLH